MAKARKHHNAEDIEAKLRQADGMAANGSTQKDISQALGISVMTYHRWRRRRSDQPSNAGTVINLAASTTAITPSAARFSTPSNMPALIVENERLRRLVTNLLLEKIALQEQLDGQKYALRRRES